MVPLGEVAKVVSGATPKTGVSAYWGGQIAWATPADLGRLDGAYIARTPRTLTEAGLRSCTATVLPTESVLLSSRAPIGHVALNAVPMATNQGFKSLVPQAGLNPKYLFHWLRAHTDYLQSLGNGATFKELSKKTVEQIEIPLPSVEEQRRIAAILDKADAIRAKRRQVLAHLDALTQSIFHDMFGEDTDHVAIGDFATVRSGSTPPREDPSNFGGNIPWVKTAEVTGVITSTSEKVTDKGLREARLKVFPSGSVVVAMYGQGKTRGQSAILGVPATTNQACAVIMPNRHFLPEFLYAQLVMNYERLRQSSEGGNQPNLSLKRVKEFGVVLPHIESQQEFASRSSEIGHKRNVLLASLGSIDALFDALQSRAFKGEL